MKKITFDNGSAAFVADAFDKKKNQEGYLVEKNTDKHVLTNDGLEIKFKKFAGVIKGSELYINNDIASLVRLSDTLNKKRKA